MEILVKEKDLVNSADKENPKLEYLCVDRKIVEQVDKVTYVFPDGTIKVLKSRY